jgi:hypothetical protein
MNIRLLAYSSQEIFAFREKILSSISTQRQKIFLVVSVALSCLAAHYIMRRYCFNANKIVTKKEPINRKIHDQVKIIFDEREPYREKLEVDPLNGQTKETNHGETVKEATSPIPKPEDYKQESKLEPKLEPKTDVISEIGIRTFEETKESFEIIETMMVMQNEEETNVCDNEITMVIEDKNEVNDLLASDQKLIEEVSEDEHTKGKDSIFFEEEEKDWVLLSCTIEDVILNDKQSMDAIAAIVAENLDEELEEGWEMISSFPDSEHEKKLHSEALINSYKHWAITAGIPLSGLGMGLLQQTGGHKTGLSLLEGVNFLTLVEVKNCAYLIPALPLLMELGEKVYADTSEHSLGQKMVRAVQGLGKEELMFLILSCGMDWLTMGTHSALVKAGLVAFDMTGHTIVKIISNVIMANELKKREESQKNALLQNAFATAAATADAWTLYKTAANFRAPQEIIAGALWGLLNLGFVQVLTTYLCNSNSASQNQEEDEHSN